MADNSIYKLPPPLNRHIDLSRMVSITDAYFIDKMGHGGYFVGFEISFQLQDNPLEFIFSLDHDEYSHKDHNTYLAHVDGIRSLRLWEFRDHKDILAIHRLQNIIDEIISVWKDFKKES